MIKIALVTGRRYLDMKSKETYLAGEPVSVSDTTAKRLLRERTFRGKHYFGRVTGDGGDPSELVVSEKDLKGKAAKENAAKENEEELGV